MAHIMSKRGRLDNIVTYEHFCDTTADLQSISQEYSTLGSIAIVITGESGGLQVYIANSQKEWKPLSVSAGSGGGGASIEEINELIAAAIGDITGFSAEIVEELPEEDIQANIIYFVPDGNGTYDEYMYINENWEKINTDVSGLKNIKDGTYTGSIIEGYITNNVVGANYTHAQGYLTTASGEDAHAQGMSSVASGDSSHAEGSGSIASGSSSHAQGSSTQATGDNSHAEGNGTTASNTSHAQGYYSIASGTSSHAQGGNSTASGSSSHAQGQNSKAIGNFSHAEGYKTKASGLYSHVQGNNNEANGQSSHAEGYYTIASDSQSHAQGFHTTAQGVYSHAEGCLTTASGASSYASGNNSQASGHYAHAEGNYTIANHQSQHVFGEYNIADDNVASSNARGTYVQIVGNGSQSARSNARTLDWSGNEVLAGSLTVGSAGITIGSTTITEAQLQALLATLGG